MLKVLEQCTPAGKVPSEAKDVDDAGPDKKKPHFDAVNDRPMLAKISSAGLTNSKLPPVTDELTKQQAQAQQKKHAAKTCTGSLCPVVSKNGVSGYEQASASAAMSADISRMMPLAGTNPRIGGKRRPLRLVLLVEDGVWPEYTLHEEGSWAAHRKFLSLEQRHAEARPCLRANIHKTEIRGPKTAPYVVYMMHIRTAFTVRGLARRYSDFVQLDNDLRAHFKGTPTNIPSLPAKRYLGQLSPEFVQDRRRQLQEYLDHLMMSVTFAHSAPMLGFLQVCPYSIRTHAHARTHTYTHARTHSRARTHTCTSYTTPYDCQRSMYTYIEMHQTSWFVHVCGYVCVCARAPA
jgi:hypothetical protein